MVFKDVPKQQAWEKYLEVERPAREEYNKALADALAAYEKKWRPAWEEFMRELEEVKHGPPIHDRKQ